MAQGALARARAPIRIPENEPEHAVITEHSAHLAEDLDQGGDILFGRRLETDLATAALIVTQLKIGRAGHHALDGLSTQWNSSRIATDDHRLSPAVRARVLKAPGAFFRPLRAARRLRKNNGVRFRDAPGTVLPGAARNVRRNLWAWGRASSHEGGRRTLPEIRSFAVYGGWKKSEDLRRADRAPAQRAGADPERAGGADQGAQRRTGVAEADHRY